MSFSDRLKKARKNAKMTQAKVAEKMGVTPAMIAQYETGKRNPKFETVKKIAAALEIDVYDLLIDGDMTPHEAMSILRAVDAKQYIQNTENKTESEQKLEYRIHQFESMAKPRPDFNNILHQLKVESNIKQILAFLNIDGQKELLHQAELISKIPEYRTDRVAKRNPAGSPDDNTVGKSDFSKGDSETETSDDEDAPNQGTSDKNHSPRIRGQATT